MRHAVAMTLVRDTPQYAAVLRAEIPGLLVIDNASVYPIDDAWMRIPCQRYFSGGWNRAMEDMHLRRNCPAWIWMLNSDVSGVSQAMMDELVAIAESENAYVVSPRVQSSQWPQMRAPHLYETDFVDWVAPLVNLEWFITNGGFDERFCGHGSDLDLCFRTLQDKKLVAGNLQVQHPYGGTTKLLNDKTMYQTEDVRRGLHMKHGAAIIGFAAAYFGSWRP